MSRKNIMMGFFIL